jgi:hypothetical protein
MMDSLIWRHLPTDLVRKIVLLSNPSIDTRLYFGIPPGRISEGRCWRLWYLLRSHDGLIYNLETQSLHILRIPGRHIIRRPVDCNRIDQWLTVFNETGKYHALEAYSRNGDYINTPSNAVFYTELRILLKGSGIARCVNIATGHTF